MDRRYLRTLFWALVILVPDVITKVVVQAELALWSATPVIPGFFNLSHVHNKGSAFGFLNDTGIDWQVPLLIATNVLAIGFMLYLLRTAKKPNFPLVTGLGIILGGAVGNLIDRIWHGYVIDFLDFYIGSYHWPSFNVADIGITVGAGLVILAYYLEDRTDASDSD